MGFKTDLAVGFAELLAAAGAGTWNASGVYTASQTGIVLRTLPQSPDRVIVLSTYPVDDDPTLSDSVIGLQVTTRWGGPDPRPTDDLDDLVFDQLHGLEGVDLSTGIRVVQCYRRSGASLGQDGNSRWRSSSNFYVDAHRPSTHRQ
jgi:hypothetical protein